MIFLHSSRLLQKPHSKKKKKTTGRESLEATKQKNRLWKLEGHNLCVIRNLWHWIVSYNKYIGKSGDWEFHLDKFGSEVGESS